MYTEDDLLPISGLQHLLFCPRRAALVYLEGVWDDNKFTAVGNLVHERVHSAEIESRGDLKISRGLFVRSMRLGLTGKTDIVEFHRTGNVNQEKFQHNAGVLPSLGHSEKVFWQPFPIEYKSGYLRHEEGYEVQLCAQALCLEEMLGLSVPQGAIFYSRTGRRLDVTFDEDIRSRTEAAARSFHELINSGVTPKTSYHKKCEKCSLVEHCLPKITGDSQTVMRYVNQNCSQLKEPP